MTLAKNDQLRSSVRTHLAAALGTTEARMEPAALRTFFETKAPLGSQKGLTYFAMLIAHMWEMVETNNMEGLMNSVALSAVFIEQVAIDGGRYQLAWLLTGLNTPAFALTTRNTQRTSEEPFAQLADPRWIAANLSFLKDMDYFEASQKAVATGEPAATTTGSAEKQAKRRARPKKKADG